MVENTAIPLTVPISELTEHSLLWGSVLRNSRLQLDLSEFALQVSAVLKNYPVPHADLSPRLVADSDIGAHERELASASLRYDHFDAELVVPFDETD
jgi:hypothetical protein